MALFDLPLAELETYRGKLEEPADFEEFWAGTVAGAREHEVLLGVDPVEAGLVLLDVQDLTFAGFDGHPVKAWYVRPRGAGGLLPVVVQYNGYGGGRGLAHQHTGWAAAGFAHLFVDTRGQGSGWGAGGHTPDPVGSGPASPGFMTRGIEDPHGHYYRRVFTDAVRAVDAVRALPGVDGERVAVAGGSQGGAMALAAAALADGVAAVMPDVPFLSHFRRALAMTDAHPYGELVKYLAVHRDAVDQVFATLAYLDVVHFARRASAPALFSVALMDMVTPPSTVYAAFNRYGELSGGGSGPGSVAKEIVVYPFNGHEGGEGHQWVRQRAWLGELFGV